MLELLTHDLARATQVIAAGNLCVIPTETVYGLGADATNKDAVAQVFTAKGRPKDHPLIVHVANAEQSGEWFAQLPDWAIALGQEFWPGPLTLVSTRTELASDFVTGGQNTVAVRVPNHDLTSALLNQLLDTGTRGLVAPSANRFGHVSPTIATHALADLGDYLKAHNGCILDGGACALGVESTIVLAVDGRPQVLRPGGITRRMIREFTGLEIFNPADDAPRVPGALAAHYAPDAIVQLIEPTDQLECVDGQGVIAAKSVEISGNYVELARPTNDQEFAQSLYAALRSADDLGLTSVAVVLPGSDGLAEAIRDRLSRAAHTN